MREELQAEMAELPAARDQARRHRRRRGRPHHSAPQAAGKPVVVNSEEAPWSDRQRDKELLEQSPEEEALEFEPKPRDARQLEGEEGRGKGAKQHGHVPDLLSDSSQS